MPAYPHHRGGARAMWPKDLTELSLFEELILGRCPQSVPLPRICGDCIMICIKLLVIESGDLYTHFTGGAPLNLGLWDDQGARSFFKAVVLFTLFSLERLRKTVQVMIILDVPSSNQIWQWEIPHKRACKDVFLDEWVIVPFAC